MAGSYSHATTDAGNLRSNESFANMHRARRRGEALQGRLAMNLGHSGSVQASEVLASLKAKLAEMELHDDLPDSHDIGYMAAWREINEWLEAEPWR